MTLESEIAEYRSFLIRVGCPRGIEDLYSAHLPIFCTFDDGIPSEDRLERVIERYMDRADIVYANGKCSLLQYERWIIALNFWAEDVMTGRRRDVSELYAKLGEVTSRLQESEPCAN
jgi:hypothetical protein